MVPVKQLYMEQVGRPGLDMPQQSYVHFYYVTFSTIDSKLSEDYQNLNDNKLNIKYLNAIYGKSAIKKQLNLLNR